MEILKYYTEVKTPDIADGTVTQRRQITLHPRKRYFLRFLKAGISGTFSNVVPENNTIRFSKDDGVTYDTIIIPEGNYSVLSLYETIKSLIDTYWTDPLIPGFYMDYNRDTQKIYIRIDSTKLAVAGQLRIDLTQSKIYELLGFNSQILSTDGLHTAENEPNIDYYGRSLSVRLENITGHVSMLNGDESSEICNIAITGGQTIYEEKNLGNYPDIEISARSMIQKFNVKFIGRDEKSVRIRNGPAYLHFAIIEVSN